jgi:hypothetical protein
MSLRRLALAALIVSAPVSNAQAKGNDSGPDISGNWTFIAKVEPGCTFTGLASFTPQPDGQFACALTARQVCTDLTFEVRQSCTLRRTGNQLSITSTIEEFIEGEPTDLYFPDNFALTIQSENRLFGALISISSYPAEFLRDMRGVS